MFLKLLGENKFVKSVKLLPPSKIKSIDPIKNIHILVNHRPVF